RSPAVQESRGANETKWAKPFRFTADFRDSCPGEWRNRARGAHSFSAGKSGTHFCRSHPYLWDEPSARQLWRRGLAAFPSKPRTDCRNIGTVRREKPCAHQGVDQARCPDGQTCHQTTRILDTSAG